LPDLLTQVGAGLSLGSRLSAGSLGQVGQSVLGTALRALENDEGFLPFQMSRWGCPKGMNSDHHWFLGTRKGVPTNGPARPIAII
jgi:hypothetical protein